MTWAQIDASSGSSSTGPGSGSSTGSGPGIDPNTQFLLYGDGTETPTCAAPYGNGACGGWRVSISIAPGSFQVGVHPFTDPTVQYSFSESEDVGGGMCSGGGGGGFTDGQVEILDITADSVHFVVSGISELSEFDPNGEYIAPRCP
jgi:hypothetical protein